MKKIPYYQYLLVACLIHSGYIYCMKTDNTEDILEVINCHGTITTLLSKTPLARPSFVRQTLGADLEKEINDMKIKDTVTIKASGENVALALDYACKNPDKIQKLELVNPKILIAGLNPFEYYLGNFPLSSLDISQLQELDITIQYNSIMNREHKAIIQLCQKGRAIVTIEDINKREVPTKAGLAGSQDELENIINQERKSQLYNKFLLAISGLIAYLLYQKIMTK